MISDSIGKMFAFLFTKIFSGLLSVIDLLPLPFDSSTVSSLVMAIPDSIWYFANAFEISAGVGIISTAMVSRFILRRIPFIGG